MMPDESYLFSEHVIGSILRGEVAFEAIIAVLNNGKLLEEHKRANREVCRLVVGIYDNKPVHVIHSKDYVLFAYIPKRPIWRTAINRDEKYLEQTGKSQSCFFCSGSLKEIIMGNFDYRLEGQLYVVKKIPARLCDGCGEKYLDAPVAKRLNEMIKQGKYFGEESVKYIEY